MKSEPQTRATSDAHARDAERSALTPAETARRLGLCRATIYRHIANGKLRTFKVGRCRRVSLDALRDFISKLETEADAQWK